jgi:hypothetical protein
MTPALVQIKTLVDELAQKIGAPQNNLPTYGCSDDGARPHVEVGNDGQLSYVVVERGRELRRDGAVNMDDLLYKVFDSVTFSMACHYEVRNRIKPEDFRRQLFTKQQELLGMLSDAWKLRKQKEYDLILKVHPFEDVAPS